jgi:hypothetical protein
MFAKVFRKCSEKKRFFKDFSVRKREGNSQLGTGHSVEINVHGGRRLAVNTSSSSSAAAAVPNSHQQVSFITITHPYISTHQIYKSSIQPASSDSIYEPTRNNFCSRDSALTSLPQVLSFIKAWRRCFNGIKGGFSRTQEREGEHQVLTIGLL